MTNTMVSPDGTFTYISSGPDAGGVLINVTGIYESCYSASAVFQENFICKFYTGINANGGVTSADAPSDYGAFLDLVTTGNALFYQDIISANYMFAANAGDIVYFMADGQTPNWTHSSLGETSASFNLIKVGN